MSKNVFFDLGSLVATGAGDAKSIEDAEEVAVQIGGTFVGTVDIELSFDGTIWVPLTGALGGATAPVVANVGIRAKQIRANVTAYTSGTIEVKASGVNPNV